MYIRKIRYFVICDVIGVGKISTQKIEEFFSFPKQKKSHDNRTSRKKSYRGGGGSKYPHPPRLALKPLAKLPARRRVKN